MPGKAKNTPASEDDKPVGCWGCVGWLVLLAIVLIVRVWLERLFAV